MTAKPEAWLAAIRAQYRQLLTALVFLATLGFALRLAGLWLLAEVVSALIMGTEIMGTEIMANEVTAADGHGVLWWLFLVWSGVALLELARHQLQARLRLQCQLSLQTALQQQLAQRQLALVRQRPDYSWHHCWVDDIGQVGAWLSEYVPQQRVAAIAPLLVLIITLSIHWLFAVLLTLTLPLVILFMVLFGEAARNRQQQHLQAFTRLGSLFVDRLRALPTLLVMQAHGAQQGKLRAASETLNQRTLEVVSVAFLSGSTIEFVTTLIMALVAVFAGFSLLGEIHLGPVLDLSGGLQLLLITPLLLAEFRVLARYYHHKAAALTAAETLASVIDSDFDGSGSNNTGFSVAGSSDPPASFDGVHWSNYRISEPTLSASSLTLDRGDHVCLRGASGSGKTVLFEALMGWRAASQAALPGKVMLMTQRPVITPATVRANLTLGHSQFTDAELMAVMSAVELDSWLTRLPAGLDTLMGTIPPLSGGEAQRLALARLLLFKPEVWLLDEPTAHLPAVQHESLCYLIARVASTYTVVWASHRQLPALDFFNRQWQVTAGRLEECT